MASYEELKERVRAVKEELARLSTRFKPGENSEEYTKFKGMSSRTLYDLDGAEVEYRDSLKEANKTREDNGPERIADALERGGLTIFEGSVKKAEKALEAFLADFPDAIGI